VRAHAVGGLTTLGEQLGFIVGPTDCKTTTCRAAVTWGDYTSARTTGMQLVERFFPGLNCAQEIRLAAPDNPNASYTTQLFLDCADQRAGVVEDRSLTTAFGSRCSGVIGASVLHPRLPKRAAREL
jgi:hypothetical protein